MTKANVDASAYVALAAKLKDSDRVVRRHVNDALKDVAEPFGLGIIEEGSGAMPARNGLRERLLSGGRVTVRMRREGAVLALQNRTGVQLGPLNKGDLRHPVFARASMSNADASRMVAESVAESGGRLKYGMRRAVSRVRNAGRKWVSQKVPAGTYTKAGESRVGELRPRVAEAVESALRELA